MYRQTKLGTEAPSLELKKASWSICFRNYAKFCYTLSSTDYVIGAIAQSNDEYLVQLYNLETNCHTRVVDQFFIFKLWNEYI